MSEWIAGLELTAGAYEHRKEIASIWSRLSTYLIGKRSLLAVTGVAGAGKTILFEHLTGRAYRLGYEVPGTSESLERGKTQSKGQRIALVVIPGQDSPPRHEAIKDVFSDKQTVDGVVHVVCNGFAALRHAPAQQALTQGMTLSRFREAQRHEELEDLDYTLGLLRQSHHKHHKPRWMIVAVDKLDLYYNDIENAHRYYYSDADSPFVKQMQEFVSQVGTDYFKWDAIPVAALPENFEWADETTESQLQQPQIDQLLMKFLRKLESYCAS